MLFLTFAATVAMMSAVAQTDGFSYQAVIRNPNGELVKTQKVGLVLTIADSAGTNVMYKEVQTATTNEFGVLSVTVGRGTPMDGTKLKNVDWTKSAWLHISIDVNGGTNYADFGATKIQAVPVALYAARSGSSAQAVGTVNPSGSGDALFDVKDKDGNVVFAVYPDGVRVYVDDDASKVRSGLVVTGRKATKDGESQDYFVVNNNGTQVIVDNEGDKAKRSGFVVTGRKATKDGEAEDLLAVNGDGTQVFVDDELDGGAKAKRSGFVVTGRKATKGDGSVNYMKVATDGTQIHFDEPNSKAKRSGFVVTGRKATKDGEMAAFMTVNPNNTRFYIDDFNVDLRRDAISINNESQLSWYPAKGIFTDDKSISTTATFKDGGNFGIITGPFTAGYECTASGEYSQAMGYKAKAEGNYSTAIGNEANAQKENSFALGKSAQAKGVASYAIGFGAIAATDSSLAIGEKANASGELSAAFGQNASATKKQSIAMGYKSKAKGDWSTALGSGASAAKYGTAVGRSAQA